MSKNLIDIALKTGYYIRKTKGHNLVIKVVILDIKNRFYLSPSQIFIEYLVLIISNRINHLI